MAMEYFYCYHSYLKKIEKLTDAEVGRMFRALLRYSETGDAGELDGREAIAFDFIAGDIDKGKTAYEEKCRKNRENGAKGGKRLPPPAPDGERPQPNAPQIKEKESKGNKLSPDGDSNARGKRTAPTPEQIQEFARIRNSGVDPKYFFEYYDNAGWRDAEGKPVYNWQQKFISWEMGDKNRTSPGCGTKRGPPAPPEPPEAVEEDIARMERYLKRMKKGEA